jgi:hypothetical protein
VKEAEIDIERRGEENAKKLVFWHKQQLQRVDIHLDMLVHTCWCIHQHSRHCHACTQVLFEKCEELNAGVYLESETYLQHCFAATGKSRGELQKSEAEAESSMKLGVSPVAGDQDQTVAEDDAVDVRHLCVLGLVCVRAHACCMYGGCVLFWQCGLSASILCGLGVGIL